MSATETAAVIVAYTPRYDGVDLALWHDPIRSFVIEHVAALQPRDAAHARRYARLLAKVAQWSLAQGVPLDIDTLLEPLTVDQFIDSLPDTQSRGTHRSDLRRMGRALTSHSEYHEKPRPLPRTMLAPYATDELDTIRRASENYPSDRWRRLVLAILVLGLGAGLDGRWCYKVDATHVVRRDGLVLISVPAPNPRVVPVRASEEDDLWRLARLARERDELLVGHRDNNRNLTQVLYRANKTLGVPPISPRRFRVTWLVAQLSAGAPLPALVEAAGVKDPAAFADLVQHATRLPVDVERGALRGA